MLAAEAATVVLSFAVVGTLTRRILGDDWRFVANLDMSSNNLSRLDPISGQDLGGLLPSQLRSNISIGVQYIEAWLRGQGCVPLYNLMEDAATAEIARAQLWQWRHHRRELDSGTAVTPDWLDGIFNQELNDLLAEAGALQETTLRQAAEILHNLIFADQLADFLTLLAYERLN